jgi:hypothetical protein
MLLQGTEETLRQIRQATFSSPGRERSSLRPAQIPAAQLVTGTEIQVDGPWDNRCHGDGSTDDPGNTTATKLQELAGNPAVAATALRTCAGRPACHTHTRWPAWAVRPSQRANVKRTVILSAIILHLRTLLITKIPTDRRGGKWLVRL